MTDYVPHGLAARVGTEAATGAKVPSAYLLERLAWVLPQTCVVEVASAEMFDAYLPPEENACVAMALPKRRREFAAGRSAARRALSRLGWMGSAIPMGAKRAPLWPHGFVGSISHCEGLCCAAAARQSDVVSLGIDVEHSAALDSSLWHLIFCDDELVRLKNLSHLYPLDWATLGFSAKEAFYKCYFGVAGQMLDFLDVRIDFTATGFCGSFEITLKDDPEASWAGGRFGVGRWSTVEPFLITGYALTYTAAE